MWDIFKKVVDALSPANKTRPEHATPDQTRVNLAAQLDKEHLRLWRTAIDELGLCQRPFFDPGSESDQKLMLTDKPVVALEVDTLAGLQRILQPDFGRARGTVVYQNWGETVTAEDGSSGRPYQWLTVERATEVAGALRGTPTRAFAFLVTMFQPGALRAFAKALGPEQLEWLGLFWYLSGDDVTDEPENATDLGYAAGRLGLARMSVLTGAFDGGCDERLAAALADAPNLRRLQVFRKDDAHTWPAVPTPKVTALLGGRNPRVG